MPRRSRGIAAMLVLAVATGAAGHGLMQTPPSRNWRCGADIEPGRAGGTECEQVFAGGLGSAGYQFMSQASHSPGRTGVVPLPKNVCSFSSGRSPWDYAHDWPTTPLAAGRNEITWNIKWGPHFDDTIDFKYWITKPDFVFDPTKQVEWSDLEEEPFCNLPYNHARQADSPDVEANQGEGLFRTYCDVPARTGHHIIYGEWGRGAGTYERFHGCIDVAMGGGVATPSTPGTAPQPQPRPQPQPQPQPPAAPACQNQLREWDACLSSPECCPSDMSCYAMNPHYAQCRKTCPESGWTCDVLGGAGMGPGATPAVQPRPRPTQAPQPTQPPQPTNPQTPPPAPQPQPSMCYPSSMAGYTCQEEVSAGVVVHYALASDESTLMLAIEASVAGYAAVGVGPDMTSSHIVLGFVSGSEARVESLVPQSRSIPGVIAGIVDQAPWARDLMVTEGNGKTTTSFTYVLAAGGKITNIREAEFVWATSTTDDFVRHSSARGIFTLDLLSRPRETTQPRPQPTQPPQPQPTQPPRPQPTQAPRPQPTQPPAPQPQPTQCNCACSPTPPMAPAPTAPRAPPAPTPASSCTQVLPEYAACIKSPGCCGAGAQCYEMNKWYAQCRKTCPTSSSWSCNILG